MNINEDYTTYEMSGNNPTEDITGSYLMLMEIIKLLNVMHDDNNIITDMQITLRTKKDFEHTRANSIGMGIDVAANKSDEEISKELNALMERWYGVTSDTFSTVQYKQFLTEFADICKKGMHKVLVGAGINDNFLYINEVNKILEQYDVPFCILTTHKKGHFSIMRNKWTKEEKED